MRSLSLCVAILCWLLSPASAQLFEIAGPTFCAFVPDDGSYTPVGPAVNGQISSAALTHGGLYFLFTIVGGQAAIDQANRDIGLEAHAVVIDDQSSTIPNLGISQQKWIANKNAWIAQNTQMGYFTFRSYLIVPKTSQSVVQLQIRDKFNNVARPVASNILGYLATVKIAP